MPTAIGAFCNTCRQEVIFDDLLLILPIHQLESEDAPCRHCGQERQVTFKAHCQSGHEIWLSPAHRQMSPSTLQKREIVCLACRSQMVDRVITATKKANPN